MMNNIILSYLIMTFCIDHNIHYGTFLEYSVNNTSVLAVWRTMILCNFLYSESYIRYINVCIIL